VGGKDGEKMSVSGIWALLPKVPVSRILTADPAGVYRSDNHGWFFPWSAAEGTLAWLTYSVLGVGHSCWVGFAHAQSEWCHVAGQLSTMSPFMHR
jgi:hypothetical protein